MTNIKIVGSENLKDYIENNLNNFNKWAVLNVEYPLKDKKLIFRCELVEIRVYSYPLGFYGLYDVYFNDVLKSSVTIPLELRFNALDLLLNKIKENRILKGLITREFNKSYKAVKNG